MYRPRNVQAYYVSVNVLNVFVSGGQPQLFRFTPETDTLSAEEISFFIGGFCPESPRGAIV